MSTLKNLDQLSLNELISIIKQEIKKEISKSESFNNWF